MTPNQQGYSAVTAGAVGQGFGTAEIASSSARSCNTTPRLLTIPRSSTQKPLFPPRSCLLTSLCSSPSPSLIWGPGVLIFIIMKHPSLPSSIHSHPIPFTPSHLSAVERLRAHLNIWMYINLLLTGAWHRFTVVQLWQCYGTICARLIKLARS